MVVSFESGLMTNCGAIGTTCTNPAENTLKFASGTVFNGYTLTANQQAQFNTGAPGNRASFRNLASQNNGINNYPIWFKVDGRYEGITGNLKVGLFFDTYIEFPYFKDFGTINPYTEESIDDNSAKRDLQVQFRNSNAYHCLQKRANAFEKDNCQLFRGQLNELTDSSNYIYGSGVIFDGNVQSNGEFELLLPVGTQNIVGK